MRNKGFGIVEGACLRAQYKDSSAPLDHRAAELNRFLLDPTIAAILPPWGGELASHHPLRELFAMAAARLAALSP